MRLMSAAPRARHGEEPLQANDLGAALGIACSAGQCVRVENSRQLAVRRGRACSQRAGDRRRLSGRYTVRHSASVYNRRRDGKPPRDVAVAIAHAFWRARCPMRTRMVYAQARDGRSRRSSRKRAPIARGLVALGVDRPSASSSGRRNVPEWIVLQFAHREIGAITGHPPNTSSARGDIDYVLRQSEGRRW